MNTKSLAVGMVGGFALLAGLGYLSLSSRGDQSQEPDIAAAKVEQSVATSQAPKLSRSLPGVVGIRAPLDGVATYADLEKSLNQSQVDPGQRLQYLITASQVCEGYQASKGSPSGANEEALKAYGSLASKFCVNFSGSSASYMDQLLAMEDSDVVVAQQISSDVDGRLSASDRALAESIFNKSSNPAAIYAAASVLAEPSVSGGWKLGRDLAKSPRELEALPQAQWIAAQLLTCDLSGGCGAGGMTTLVECGSYSMCSPSVTTREILQKMSTPVQFELAERIHRKLSTERTGA